MYCLQEYRPYISKENQEDAKILERCVKRSLPQYREEVYIEEYNQQALALIKETKSKGVDKSENAKKVLAFFKSINEINIKSFKASPLKIELYKTISKYIDVAPQDFDVQISRTNIHITLTGEDS